MKFFDVVIPRMGRSVLDGTTPFLRSVYENDSLVLRSAEELRSGLYVRGRPDSGLGGPKYAPSFLDTCPAPSNRVEPWQPMFIHSSESANVQRSGSSTDDDRTKCGIGNYWLCCFAGDSMMFLFLCWLLIGNKVVDRFGHNSTVAFGAKFYGRGSGSEQLSPIGFGRHLMKEHNKRRDVEIWL